MRTTMNKTEVTISGEWQKAMQKAVGWPHGVWEEVSTNCQKWVQEM